MEKFSTFVGIDVSKGWLDIAVICPENGREERFKIDNTEVDVRKFIRSSGSGAGDTLFCLENSGSYCEPFLEVAERSGLNVWLEHPLQLKRSLGMARGKTDEIDAARIADYAYRFQDRARLWEPDSEALKRLRKLQTKRDILVKSAKQLKQAMEGKDDPYLSVPLKRIKEAIADIEGEMKEVVDSCKNLSRQYMLLNTVPGIGKITAVTLLVITKGFTVLTDPRKLACFSGVAPFPYRSGSSIRYRDRVSKMGNMRLKALLSLSAFNAVRSVPALKEYFERKRKEGKSTMCVINAVRNKLLSMTLSVIRRDTPFSKEYSVR